MGDLIYRPLIEDMTWSYSRLQSFHDCPYRWFLKYILNTKEEPLFYSSYGKFIHKLLEKYYKGEIKKEDLPLEFISNFSEEVEGERPSGKIVSSYIEKGLSYFENFEPFDMETLGVEKKVEFDVEGFPFVGFIDYIGKRENDLYVVDNKSRDLKPRSKKGKKTVADNTLDGMLRQLYLYSMAIKSYFYSYPKYLCFNCFKNQTFIKESFDEKALEETKKWAVDTIKEIENTEEFLPKPSYFGCEFLCPFKNDCCYYEMR